jgi:hypothetical protein
MANHQTLRQAHLAKPAPFRRTKEIVDVEALLSVNLVLSLHYQANKH